MKSNSPDLRNFLTGAVGYLIGALAGFIFLFLAARIGVGGWLFGLIDQNQVLLQILGIPLIAGFLLFLGGAITGGIGGWALARLLILPRRTQMVAGSGLAFGLSTGLLSLVFLLLIGFMALYNNFTENQVEHYGAIFGLFGLVYGAFSGLLQALMSLRLRHSWRVILASTIGFTLGGILMGLLVRLVNPTDGFKTYPILTWLALAVGLLAPFTLGGGVTGFTLGRLARLSEKKDDYPGYILPSGWQTGVVALLGLVLVFGILNTLGSISEFLTINPASLQTQLKPVTAGVRWGPSQLYSGDADLPSPDQDEVMFIDNAGIEHRAWCEPDGLVLYQSAGSSEELFNYPPCGSAPALAVDSDGQAHLVWYTQEVEDSNGVKRSVSVLVESIRTSEGWSDPAIVAHTDSPTKSSLSLDAGGDLLLVWEEDDQDRFFAVQESYNCDPRSLSDLERVGLEVILSSGFRPAGIEPAYCRNKFERILYTPNPQPEFSDQPITRDGAFDQVSTTIPTAEYEVLFATMQYEPANPPPSPGSVLAEGVNNIYQQVKANPGKYPRGMTVRILLGNYPEMSDFTWGDQIYNAISDIRAAGVEKMVDPEIGWRLEVANFSGTYPHSHTKFVIIDGKSVIGVGYNYGYLHLPMEHPSGRGFDMFDLGVQITGPVAQDAISAYDDMWDGADQIHCEDFHPQKGDWTTTCETIRAVDDHVPEVLRTYLPPEGDSNAFSLYRTEKYKEGDQFIAASLAGAEETIDMMQVNFSLEAICMANLIFPDLCTFDKALPWMEAILKAVETNGVRVRAIVENTNSNGLENRIGGQTLMDALEKRGLGDLLEIRFYNGKLHAKSTLIDGMLLIIGSQNMHYSSWGASGLTEYSLATDDPQAIEEYQAMFEAKWEEAIPFEEAEYGTSP